MSDLTPEGSPDGPRPGESVGEPHAGGPGSGGPRSWRSVARSRAALAAGGGLAALALAAGALAVFTPGSAEGLDGDDPGVGLPVTADPVDGGPLITALPERCGLTESTLNALVPGPEVRNRGDFGTCQWSGERNPERGRYLDVELVVKRADTATAEGALNRDRLVARTFTFPGNPYPVPMSPQAAAIDAIGPKYSNVEMTAVTGLGDEAIAGFSGDRALVVFRVRNVAGTVAYRSSGPVRRTEKETRDGAVRVASDIARSLGKPVSSAPKQIPQDGRALGALPSKLCGLVPGTVLERVMKGRPSAEEDGAAGSGPVAVGKPAQAARCTWTSGQRKMAVVAKAFPDSKIDGGVRLATREYLMQHHNARAEEPLATKGKKYFTALSGLGEQAFGAYTAESSPARVLFRVRNVLVEVSFARSDGREPADGKQAVAAAYAAAAHVAKAL